MKYPKPTDRYDCSILCGNFEEIEERLSGLEQGGTGSGGGATEEQIAQIETNRQNIERLYEEIVDEQTIQNMIDTKFNSIVNGNGVAY